MTRAIRGPVRLNHGCWGLVLTPSKTPQVGFTVMMSVPKRLLRLSVWRNQARRIARESWRAANIQLPYQLEASQGYTLMLRLMRKPTDQLKNQPAAIIGATKIKALLRHDCDVLLLRLSTLVSGVAT